MLPDEPLLSPSRILTSLRFWWYFLKRDIDCPGMERQSIPFWVTLYYHRRPLLAERDGHPNWS